MYIFLPTCKFTRPDMITDHQGPQDVSSRQGTGKTNPLARPLGWCVCWGLISLMVGPVYGQTAEVTQRVIPAAELTDLAFIRTFLEEQFILPEDPEFTHALFFDLTRDGFGSNDVLILYPAEEQFQIGTYLPERMAEALRTQGLATDYNLVTSREFIGMVSEEAEQELSPKKALAGTFLESVLNYYPGGDFEGYISQQGDNVRVSFWGYEENLWQFAPAAAQCVQPDAEPLILVAHQQPEIRSFLDVDGCVVVETTTAGAQVSSRECDP